MAKVKDPVWVPVRAVADEVDAAATIQALACGSLSEDALATWIDDHIRKTRR